MHKVLLTAALVATFYVAPAFSASRIAGYIPDLKPVGAGRFSVFMLDIYDATLLAQNGQWHEGKPLALQLTYLRTLKGHKIADRSAQEMRNIGITDEVKLASWHTQMQRIFPDVHDGVTLTGILTAENETIFLLGDQEIGRIKDPDFGVAFFGIWLNEKTSAPSLRQKLLGSS